jgi:hypothetical protein
MLFLFTYDSNNPAATLTIKVPSGALGAYMSAWGVSQTTPAGGGGVYGSSCYQIVIDDSL